MTGFGFGADRFGWTDDALAELRGLRGWTEAALERLEVRYDAPSGVVGFPLRDATLGDLGVVRYLPRPEQRNGRRKMQQPAGVERQLFPPPETLGDDVLELVLGEGEPDAVAAWSAGFAAIGVPGTGGWRDEYAARFSGRRWTVHVVFDCDESGRAAADHVAASLVAAGVDARVVDLDPARGDGYDLTDFLRDHGADGLRARLAAAELWTPPDLAPWRSTPWPTFRDTAPEQHRWLVEGLLPAGALAFVAGPPKKGKTWLGIAIALALATGRPLLGYPVERCAVLYVALEGSRTGLRARIGALARGFDADPDSSELDDLHMLYRPRPFDLAELVTAEWLDDEARRVDAGLVIVDVLRAAARFRENDAEDFARVRDSFEPLLVAERTALLLHHFGKLNETQKERSPGERMAGTGAMYGALDVGLLITSSSEGARRMRVDVEARDFAAPDAIGVAILGDGSGEHGGFTYTDRATLELDEGALDAPDYAGELEQLFAGDDPPVWRTLSECASKAKGIGRNKDEVRKALDTAVDDAGARRFAALEPPEGERVGRHKSAKPYGTRAMLETLESAEARADEQLALGGGSSVPSHPSHPSHLGGEREGGLGGSPYGGSLVEPPMPPTSSSGPSPEPPNDEDDDEGKVILW